jgi:hypothetical protein
LVEHILGKDEVTSSILVVGSSEEDDYAEQYYFGLHGMQAEKLCDDEKQADNSKPPGNEEILQVLPGA